MIEPEPKNAHQFPKRETVQPPEAIEGSLAAKMENDERLQSGIPPHLRATGLDFVRMAGLTRPRADVKPEAPAAAYPNPPAPASFFDFDAADVDAAASPRSVQHEDSRERDSDPAEGEGFALGWDHEPTAILPGSENDDRAPVTVRFAKAEELLQALENQPRDDI